MGQLHEEYATVLATWLEERNRHGFSVGGPRTPKELQEHWEYCETLADRMTALIRKIDARPMPEVGDPATVNMGSDRHAGTVVRVSRTGSRVTIQQDRAIRLDSNGMSEAQKYRFERDPDGPCYTATRRKDGSYHLVGARSWFGYVSFALRSEYYDYSF